MPTVQVPLKKHSDIPKLSRDRQALDLLAEKIALKQQEDRVKVRLEEVNRDLYLLLDKDLPDDVKSFEFDGYMHTKIDAGESSSFDKSKLMKIPIPCLGCKECKKKKVTVFVTQDVIAACTTKEPRKPTVRTEKIKSTATGTTGTTEQMNQTNQTNQRPEQKAARRTSR